jgi:lambda family phage portal protein
MKINFGSLLDSAIEPFFPQWAVRRAAARYRFNAFKEFDKKQHQQLSVFEAAKYDRTNRDWMPRRGSADQAILGDYATLLVRARALQRDNWATASLLDTFGRNVWGRGILPISAARKPWGGSGEREELRDFNERKDELFGLHWSRRRKHCDVTRKQSFWAKGFMAVQEMVCVGEHFVAWSYSPNPESVGLQLQSFEPEQLNIFKIQEASTGNYVRLGIEVNDIGATVAYHFYRRPLNDWFPFLPASVSGSIFEESERIPAERMMHLMIQRRTQQSHGYTWLAPIMSKLRNCNTVEDAMILASKVEASIAIGIEREDAGTGNPFQATSLPPREDELTDSAGNPLGIETTPDTVTRDGGRQWPIEPTLIFDGRPGEKLQFPDRKTPGAQYENFMKLNWRSSAAGVGASYDEMARDFDQGNYSSKRQNAIEGRRGYSVIQDRVVEEYVQPVNELFTQFAILEDNITPGRWGLGVTMTQYLADPFSFAEAEYVPDGFENIDALKEASGDSINLDKRLDTRKRIIARRYGANWRRVFQQIADEQKEAARVNITLPDVEPIAPRTSGDEPPNGENEGEDDSQNPPKPGKNPKKKNGAHYPRSFSDRVIDLAVEQSIRG